jgi:ABC-type lipoprotein release transport system permease subunit
LIQKIKWPERERTIVLVGIRGEVPIAHRDPKAPLIEPVEKGTLTVGFELAQSLQLAVDQDIALLGKEFKIGKIHDERGSADDITIWIHLQEMQALLGLEGQINEIRALECNCASVDRLGEIRAEIGGILPNTQIIEIESRALARAEARNEAKRSAQEQLAQMKEDRSANRAARERLLAWILPTLLLLSMAWIAYLALSNVRERFTEIATLRTLGVGSSKMLGLFLGRAALQGLVGASLGLLITWIIARSHGVMAAEWLVAALGAPLLAMAAAWLPCLVAASRDPAEVLRQD